MEISYQSQKFSINEQSQIGSARRYAIILAKELNFSDERANDIAIVASEAATNLLKHTPKGGEIIFRVISSPFLAIEILALDKGSGIHNIPLCMEDGFSTANTLGGGLGAIKRLSDVFDIYSLPNQGTALLSQIRHILSPARNLPEIDIGGVCIPIDGETVCGDGWSILSKGSKHCILLADGLGHGIDAHQAAAEAINSFNHDDFSSLNEAMYAIHNRLKKTRGAALALATIDLQKLEVEFLGIGNVLGLLISAERSKNLLTLNGIVGHEMRKLQSVVYPFTRPTTLLLFSDGLQSRFDLNQYPNLLNKHPSIIAGILYRDYSRGRDDITVLAIKVGTI